MERQYSCSGALGSNMDSLNNNHLGATEELNSNKVDFIAKLPLEISQMILRQLDPESLLAAAQVSSKWLDVCRSDKYLRDTAKNWIISQDIPERCFIHDLCYVLKYR